jgi:hypothetical protein
MVKPVIQVQYASHLNQCSVAGICAGASLNFSAR